MSAIAEATAAANRLAELLEARGGLRHPNHEKAVKLARAKVERVLRAYWRRQAEALVREIRPKMHQAVSMFPQEAKSDPGRRFSHALLPDSLSPLRFPVTAAEAADFAAAIEGAIRDAAATLAAELKAAPALSENFASNWLRDHSLTKLTGDFSAESVDRLRNSIADAWDAGGSADQIVDAIKDTFDDFSDARAEMIAQTEVNEAYNAARVDLAHEMGFDEKHWDADGTEACDECEEQIAAGWIEIDDDFPGGDDPPLHPRCDCGVNFRKGAED